MNDWNVLSAVVIGLVLRIGLPIAATALVIFFLRRLDNQWKAEATERMLIPMASSGKPCWEVKKCSPEQMKTCPAASQTASPCWQFFRTDQGALKETCLGCEVFRLAPLPIGD
jgi:hypothetical protein